MGRSSATDIVSLPSFHPGSPGDEARATRARRARTGSDVARSPRTRWRDDAGEAAKAPDPPTPKGTAWEGSPRVFGRRLRDARRGSAAHDALSLRERRARREEAAERREKKNGEVFAAGKKREGGARHGGTPLHLHARAVAFDHPTRDGTRVVVRAPLAPHFDATCRLLGVRVPEAEETTEKETETFRERT